VIFKTNWFFGKFLWEDHANYRSLGKGKGVIFVRIICRDYVSQMVYPGEYNHREVTSSEELPDGFPPIK
jgi:hypothetical protein